MISEVGKIVEVIVILPLAAASVALMVSGQCHFSPLAPSALLTLARNSLSSSLSCFPDGHGLIPTGILRAMGCEFRYMCMWRAVGELSISRHAKKADQTAPKGPSWSG